MGKVNKLSGKLTLTPFQRKVFNKFADSPKLVEQFYFTGGTALSAVYLHHRESEDLDFFSKTEFDYSLTELFIEEIAKAEKAQVRLTEVEQTRVYQLIKANKTIIKIDFAYYPYQQLEQGLIVQGVRIDSLLDIATNKLQTIVSRSEVKDFVDLYFLLKQFTLWDLIYAVRKKFNKEIDLVWLAADFLKVEEFDYLPKMVAQLNLPDLKEFYREQAIKLGAKIVKK